MKKSSLKQVSDKQRARLIAYNKAKKEWLEEHPGCQFVVHGIFCNRTYGCTVHHKMRRGKYIADKTYFMTVCVKHHNWIEEYKREARNLGYILYK